jgi:putative effector of murein hydrolase
MTSATVAIYSASLRLAKMRVPGLSSAMFTGSSLLLALLAGTHATVSDYAPARDVLGALLGPALVAFAVPIFKHRAVLRANAVPIAIALFSGAISTALIAFVLALALRFPAGLSTAVGFKSITTPVAVELASRAHAAAGIAALAVFLTARIGEMLGPAILDAAGIAHPLARGLSIGCITTTGGVSRIAREGELTVAGGALAVGICAFAAGAFGGFAFPILGAFAR